MLKADLEYLNGKGEFGTPASKIRGIAYYQRSLDSLAQTLANTMNDMNRPLDLDAQGKPQIGPDGKPLRKEANLSGFDGTQTIRTLLHRIFLFLRVGWTVLSKSQRPLTQLLAVVTTAMCST